MYTHSCSRAKGAPETDRRPKGTRRVHRSPRKWDAGDVDANQSQCDRQGAWLAPDLVTARITQTKTAVNATSIRIPVDSFS